MQPCHARHIGLCSDVVPFLLRLASLVGELAVGYCRSVASARVFVKEHLQDKRAEGKMQAKFQLNHWRNGVSDLSEPAFLLIREPGKYVLKDFSQPSGINACHSRRKPRFAHSPPFRVQMDSGTT